VIGERLPSAVYVSPHLDDAVLSCGAAIAERTSQGERVLVVTVCTGEPERIGPFAARLHAFWGLSAGDAVTLRRAEDRNALARLGAEAMHLGLLDAIYRRPDLYDCDERLYGPILDDEAYVDHVCRRLLQLYAQHPNSTWYVPLGVGRHVDHQIAHVGGRRLLRAGARVGFYEDVPYVFASGALETRLGDVSDGDWCAVKRSDASTDAIDLWLSAIGEYRSQFVDHSALGCAVRAHAAAGQRVWWQTVA
jgi:LmbE family N-acetylglucosaminyl deacetylase